MASGFLPTKITINNQDVLDLGRDFLTASREGAEEAAKDWHEKVLPDHFTMGGFKKYNYQLRVLGYRSMDPDDAGKQVRYTYRNGVVLEEEPIGQTEQSENSFGSLSIIQKERQKARRVKVRLKGVPYTPLVKTGRLKREVLGVYRLSSGSHDVKIIMNAPKHAYEYRKDSKSPDKIAEITTVLQSEADHMAQIVADVSVDRLNRKGVK